MNSSSIALSPSALRLDDLAVIRAVMERISEARSQALTLRAGIHTACEFIAGRLNGQEIVLMLRNKFGLSKKDAQKLYYDVRNKGKKEPDEDPGDDQKGSEPKSIDQKISMIMDYMHETSAKLDSIDRDISDLKKQVEEILRRI